MNSSSGKFYDLFYISSKNCTLICVKTKIFTHFGINVKIIYFLKLVNFKLDFTITRYYLLLSGLKILFTISRIHCEEVDNKSVTLTLALWVGCLDSTHMFTIWRFTISRHYCIIYNIFFDSLK